MYRLPLCTGYWIHSGGINVPVLPSVSLKPSAASSSALLVGSIGSWKPFSVVATGLGTGRVTVCIIAVLLEGSLQACVALYPFLLFFFLKAFPLTLPEYWSYWSCPGAWFTKATRPFRRILLTMPSWPYCCTWTGGGRRYGIWLSGVRKLSSTNVPFLFVWILWCF